MKNCAERSCALLDGHGGMCRSMLAAYDARILRYESECLMTRNKVLEEALELAAVRLDDAGDYGWAREARAVIETKEKP